MREFFKRKGIVFPLGIAFFINNYFCGNISVFAKPSMYVKYYFGRLPCKNRTANGFFLSAKMRST